MKTYEKPIAELIDLCPTESVMTLTPGSEGLEDWEDLEEWED